MTKPVAIPVLPVSLDSDMLSSDAWENIQDRLVDENMKGNAKHSTACIALDCGHVAFPDSVYAGHYPEPIPHLTIAFLGETERLNKRAILRALESYAKSAAPISAKVTAISAFDAEEEIPVVALVDSVELPKLYQQFEGMIPEDAKTHGFIPHITLYYADRDEEIQIEPYGSDTFTLDSICLLWGDRKYCFKLGG